MRIWEPNGDMTYWRYRQRRKTIASAERVEGGWAVRVMGKLVAKCVGELIEAFEVVEMAL